MPGIDLNALKQALAIQGKDSSFLDDAVPARQETPVAPTVPPEMNKALETTGSSYRVPEQTPAPAPVETSAPAPQQTEPALPQTPDTVPTRALGREFREGQNRSLALEEITGDNSGKNGEIAAQGLDQVADLKGQQADERRQGLDRMASRRDAALSRKDFNRDQAYAELEQMRSRIKNPPDNTVGKVLNIVASVVAMGGNKNAASGLQMLGQAMSSDLQEWEQEIAGNDALMKKYLQMNDAEDGSVESELRQEGAISTLAAGVYDAAIDKVMAETQSKEARAVGQEMKNGLRQQYIHHQMQLNQKAGLLKQQTALIRAIAGQPTPEARAALAAQYGKAGLAALAEIQKGDKSAADINATNVGTAKTAAEIQKLRSEGGGGSGAEVLPGFVDTVGLEKGDLADVRKNARITAMIENDIKQLKAIRQKHNGGTFNQNDVAAAKDIISGITGKMSQYSGAGAPSEAEREMFVETMTDPTGFYMLKDPIEIYDQKIDRLKAGQRASYEAIGLKPTGQAASSTTPGSFDPAFRPGTTSTPSAASRGITTDASGQIALPNAKVNLTPEQAAGIPEAFLRGR